MEEESRPNGDTVMAGQVDMIEQLAEIVTGHEEARYGMQERELVNCIPIGGSIHEGVLFEGEVREATVPNSLVAGAINNFEEKENNATGDGRSPTITWLLYLPIKGKVQFLLWQMLEFSVMRKGPIIWMNLVVQLPCIIIMSVYASLLGWYKMI